MRTRKIVRRRNNNLILELTPLIDVVFLLLIFFMVATTFKDVNSGIDIELPQSSIQEKAQVESIQVLMNLEGDIVVNLDFKNEEKSSVKTNFDELKEVLADGLSKSDKKEVIISADKKLDYGSIVKLMTLAKEAGASSLNIDAAPMEE
jgi:biopolymer transport protein ExbD